MNTTVGTCGNCGGPVQVPAAWYATIPPTRADLIAALKFYATGEHFILSEPAAWDTVSGEPQNWQCDEAGTATVEDGWIAKATLEGRITAEQIEALEDGETLDEATQPAAAPQPEPVHGDVLPPLGSRVWIRHGRDDDAHACTVVGYYAWPDLAGNKRLHRVFVHLVYEGTANPQARMLCDVWATEAEALAGAAPQPVAQGDVVADVLIDRFESACIQRHITSDPGTEFEHRAHDHARDEYDAARAALAAFDAAVSEVGVRNVLLADRLRGAFVRRLAALGLAPDGWRLVPVEPTDDMNRAAVIYANGNAVYKNVASDALKIEESIYGEVWSAMLAAAPQPPAAQPATVKDSLTPAAQQGDLCQNCLPDGRCMKRQALCGVKLAAQQGEAVEAISWTIEHHIALREAHETEAERDYFAARPHLDDQPARERFDAGFKRGFDAAASLKDSTQPAAAPQQVAQGDDKAVDEFAGMLKKKLAKARAKGKSGWRDPAWSEVDINRQLHEHAAKGDPLDVAAYAMFLALRGEKTTAAPAGVAGEAVAPDGRLHADGYFTWARRDGYVMDRRLPCDFYLAAPPARQALSDVEIDAIGNGLNGHQQPISRRERDRLIARAVIRACAADWGVTLAGIGGKGETA